MGQPFSLQPLLDLMQTRTDEATRTLGKLIAAEQSQRSRLQMLEQYREEYAQRLRENIAQGITRLVMLNYQDFLARIDEAIEQQRQAVRTSEQSTRAGQEHWQQQNKQLKAIDKRSGSNLGTYSSTPTDMPSFWLDIPDSDECMTTDTPLKRGSDLIFLVRM